MIRMITCSRAPAPTQLPGQLLPHTRMAATTLRSWHRPFEFCHCLLFVFDNKSINNYQHCPHTWLVAIMLRSGLCPAPFNFVIYFSLVFTTNTSPLLEMQIIFVEQFRTTLLQGVLLVPAGLLHWLSNLWFCQWEGSGLIENRKKKWLINWEEKEIKGRGKYLGFQIDICGLGKKATINDPELRTVNRKAEAGSKLENNFYCNYI